MTPEETPPEVLEGKPLSFLERLDPPMRRITVLNCLAVLSECREHHEKDPNVLMGLVTLEKLLKRNLQANGNATPVRTVYASERPTQ